MISPSQYRETLLGLVEPFGTVRMPLDQAQRAVLAEPVIATSPIPRFDVSAMDGFALRAQGASGPLRVVDDLPAGTSANPEFADAECVAIMTGAPIPDAADTVVPIERVRVDGDVITLSEPDAVRPGQHIRRQGEDVTVGDVVAPAGAVVTPGICSAAAACGVSELTVRRRPRIAVAATGDELRPAGTQLAYGEIYESNSVFVAGLLNRAETVVFDALPDDADTIRTALDAWADEFDVIVLTGGAGGGAHDVPGQVVASAPRQGRAQVRMQPGKPQAWAVWNGTPVIVLPGNPLAAAASAQRFVVPVIDRMMGAPARSQVRAVAASALRGKRGKTQFVPVMTRVVDGRFLVEQAHERGLGSHLVSTVARAHGFAVIPEDSDGFEAGALVDVLLFGQEW